MSNFPSTKIKRFLENKVKAQEIKYQSLYLHKQNIFRMAKTFITLFLLLYAINNIAQSKQLVGTILYQGDTIPHIYLKPVNIYGKGRHAARYFRQEKRNLRLEYNVRKVYPYARIAANKVNEIELRLSQITKESERRKVLKEEYSQLMKAFKAPLMKLSITQGKILIRLIYRETNHTSFAHIREYRGAVNAYFWQSIALLFGNNLKTAYDPDGEDAEIEKIVQKILQEK